MGFYPNLSIDLPQRIGRLDAGFRRLAQEANLDVSYGLMKLSAAFLLPFERIEGDSGGQREDFAEPDQLGGPLEFGTKFVESSYCSRRADWTFMNVPHFINDRRDWASASGSLNLDTLAVLAIIRHALAHANLAFDGTPDEIAHVYFGNRRRPRRAAGDPAEGPYDIVRCTVHEMHHFADVWISKLQTTRVNPATILRELDEAA